MYPNEPLLDEAKRILYYLVLTKDLGIRYIRGPAPHLYGMTESDRREVYGALVVHIEV